MLWLAPWIAHGQTPPSAPDSWVTNVAALPASFPTNLVRSNGFETLRAEAIVGRMKVFWSPERTASNAAVTAWVSFDAPGHWPARDWRSHVMSLRDHTWETTVPVTDVDLPMVYFVNVNDAGATTVSPLRVCDPRSAGLEEPTRVFWPFLEGFEEGLESWQLLTEEAPPLKTEAAAHTGRAALVVSLPAGKRSVTVATTRLRGWHTWKQNATGVRVWLRVREGEGRVRFTLLANARTTNEVIRIFPQETRLTNGWRKVDLFFSSVPKLPLPAVDLLAFEFIGEGPREFLMDDLQLLGPWKSDWE